MSGGVARYFFLPWLRRGLAAPIPVDAIPGNAPAPRVELDVRLQVVGLEDSPPTKTVALRGPGDILGFASRVVVRTEPRRDAGDFEPNYFPFIEFAEPDFPWRYSPLGKASGDSSNLKPWIALVVLRADEVQEDRYPESQIPRIRVDTGKLPSQDACGRWAHVQVSGYKDELPDAESVAAHLPAILEREPERVVARLLCPRHLQAGVKYNAYVVPTFKLGVDAASSGSAATGGSALTPAWPASDSDQEVELPYYYKWEFQTGRRGDFEHLVRRLEPRQLTGLGLRDVDCGQPGYTLDGPGPLGFESALKSIDTQYTPWGGDSDRSSSPESGFRTGLGDLLNMAEGAAESPEADDDPTPRVVPPLYGRWHRAQARVDPESDDWFDVLNLDPRHRWAAGLGAEVVRKEQEQLMASAWDQLGDIEAVNAILRRAQLGEAVSAKAEVRLNCLSTGDYLRVTAAVHGQARAKTAGERSGGESVAKIIRKSPIGAAPLDPAMRRVARSRGSLRKRQAPRVSATDFVFTDVLERLNQTPAVESSTPAKRPIPPLKVVNKAIVARGVPTFVRLAESVAQRTKLKITSEPPQLPSSGEFRYVLAYEKPGGGLAKVTIEIDGAASAWLSVKEHKEGQAIIGGTPTPPSLVKGALASAAEVHHVTIHVDGETQAFDIRVWSKAGPIAKALAGGSAIPQSPVVYAAAANIRSPLAIGAQDCSETRLADNVKDYVNGKHDTEKPAQPDPTAAAVAKALEGWLNPKEPQTEEDPQPANLEELAEEVKEQLAPAGAIAGSAYGQFRCLTFAAPTAAVQGASDTASASDVPPAEAAALELIAAAPEFPQPMWNALEELSEQYLLAGIDKVPQNTIALLETNRRFVEAFFCGLNHEFSRELLWREYPSDQRGTYFRQFWDKSDYLPSATEVTAVESSYRRRTGYDEWSEDDKLRFAEIYGYRLGATQSPTPDAVVRAKAIEEWLKDIPPMVLWNAPLGRNFPESHAALAKGQTDPASDGEDDGQLVLLIRGDLLNRYPNAAIYALRGEESPKDAESPEGAQIAVRERRYPIFAVTVKPDIACIGLPLTTEDAIDDGWYLVLEERMSETRFGLDESAGGGEADLSWEHFAVAEDAYLDNKEPSTGPLGSAANVASSTMQRPVRVVIRATRIIPPVARVQGRIHTQDGTPIAGATVTVGGKSVETDDIGAFSLDRLHFGRQTLTARHPDYQEAQTAITLLARGVNDVALALIPLPGVIVGTVTDHLRHGLSGARVSYTPGPVTTPCKPDGGYEFAGVAVGNYRVTATCDGFQTASRDVAVQSKMRAVVTFALTPTTGTIEGTVSDPFGKGLAGARVAAGGKTTESIGTGGYTLPGVPVGGQTVSVALAGFQAAQASVVVQGGKSAPLSFKLIPTTGTLRGTVKDAKGALLTGVTVSAGGLSRNTENGQFSLTGVPMGSLTLTLKYSGYVTKRMPITLKGGETKVINEVLYLLPGSVSGTVTKVTVVKGRPKKSPAKGARVTLGTRSTSTDAAGAYKFTKVPAGSYKADVTYTGCKAIGTPRNVVVLGGGQKESPVNFSLTCTPPSPTSPNINIRVK